MNTLRIAVIGALFGLVPTSITTFAIAQTNDHLKCYKIKDNLKLAGTADLDTPQFGPDPGCTVSKTTLFCVPATKTNVAVRDKTTGTPITPLPVTGPDPGDRICYKIKCPALLPTDAQVTDQFGNRQVAKFKASLLCTPAFKGYVRYVDNGDGTVTDNYTGLQWEQKNSAGGGADLTNPHDVDNAYTWSISPTGAADGTAYTDFLSRLNTCTSSDGVTVTASFAGHCDWRLPTIAELQTILLAAYPCGTSPCIDPVFGPTPAPPLYWSSTTYDAIPLHAFLVFFGDGSVVTLPKGGSIPIRAVRGGS